jgi:glycosyltransferase involved in cell wall biosynthesis
VSAARPVRVLELRSVQGTGGGPEKTILLGARVADPAAVAVTVCYVRDARDAVFSMDVRAAAAGVDYVEVIEQHSLDPRIWGQLVDLVSRRKIDLVHAHDYKTDLLAWLLAWRTGVRALATAHAWTGHSLRERLVYYPLDKRLLARFPCVIAVSNDVRNALLASGAREERVRVLPNGIDHRDFRRGTRDGRAIRRAYGLPEKAVVLGAVGRLEPQKRFDVLVQAFAQVRRSVPEARLIIAGEGSARTLIEQTMREQGVETACILPGHVSDVIGLHHVLDLFVQSSSYEGTPNVVLEAMALETAIVATDVGGTAELARPEVDAIIVRPNDPAALADGIKRALSDTTAMARRVASARQRVESELAFETRVRKLEAIYRELALMRQP